jgi:cell division protein FtsW (lipid II flippase)
MYGAYGLAMALWVAAGGLRPLPVAVLIVALLLLSLGSLIVLFQRTRYWKWGNSPDADLDEFQVASRNEAYKTAYIIVATLTLLVMFIGRIASDTTDFVISESAREFMFWGWFLLVLTLPAALLAWTEKPLDDDGVLAARR